MDTDTSAQTTFDEICAALSMMGLSQVIAAPVLTHACRVAGVAPEALGPGNVAALGPILERSLRMYLGAEEIAASLARIYALDLGQNARPTTRNTLVAVSRRKPDGT
jgi:hypothetical protein